MIRSANLGYPRFGASRELKKALEAYWRGRIDQSEFLGACRQLRQHNWHLQQQAHIDFIPSNDFSFYDHVLDMIAAIGAVPERYHWNGKTVDLDTYFAMARGTSTEAGDVPPMEMSKWFDTNYHYIVPEFSKGQRFSLSSTRIVNEFKEALELGITARPVLLGPVSFLMLGKSTSDDLDPLDLLDGLLPVYQAILHSLAEASAEWVQIDEPCLALDLDSRQAEAYTTAYTHLAGPDLPKRMLTTYFGSIEHNLPLIASLPLDGLHIDLTAAPQQLEGVLGALPQDVLLSLGVVDGRNVWITDLEAALALVDKAATKIGGDNLVIAPSCSLQFVPYDLDLETELDSEVRPWLAFARQKLSEIDMLKEAANGGAVEGIKKNKEALKARRSSTRTHDPAVQQAMSAITPEMLRRKSPFAARKALQAQRFDLPLLPATTIGSFPQTQEVRRQRAAFRKGDTTEQQYHDFLKGEIERTIRFQEDIGLDVLVHGEFERTDMVEYFGQQLNGFIFTQHGWVQSYGSRGVRPPIIYGDVSRKGPMTVDWSVYAQSLTDKPVKGMLTGPVTILKWSFVRDDLPRPETCRQIALAIREEVGELEASGISMIQIDEPAFREGLPLRRSAWDGYLGWAVECFLLASTGVKDETQVHTHMCYSEFNDFIASIEAMDADVISIEASRSKMELLQAFRRYHYANDIGPGIYDIHSPIVPSRDEMVELLLKALDVIDRSKLWVNPDCGLKTRRWQEVEPALRNMMEATRQLREKA